MNGKATIKTAAAGTSPQETERDGVMRSVRRARPTPLPQVKKKSENQSILDPALDDAAMSSTVKLPDFFSTDLELWFGLVERAFEAADIGCEMARYRLVCCALDHEYAQKIRDLVITPPAKRPYSTLKKTLLKRVRIEKLGEANVTQALQQLRELLDPSKLPADSEFRSLWSYRIGKPLSRLAENANKFFKDLECNQGCDDADDDEDDDEADGGAEDDGDDYEADAENGDNFDVLIPVRPFSGKQPPLRSTSISELANQAAGLSAKSNVTQQNTNKKVLQPPLYDLDDYQTVFGSPQFNRLRTLLERSKRTRNVFSSSRSSGRVPRQSVKATTSNVDTRENAAVTNRPAE